MEFSLSSFLSQHFSPINFNVTVQQKKNANDFEWDLYLFFLCFVFGFFFNMESSVHPRQQKESTKY